MHALTIKGNKIKLSYNYADLLFEDLRYFDSSNAAEILGLFVCSPSLTACRYCQAAGKVLLSACQVWWSGNPGDVVGALTRKHLPSAKKAGAASSIEKAVSKGAKMLKDSKKSCSNPKPALAHVIDSPALWRQPIRSVQNFVAAMVSWTPSQPRWTQPPSRLPAGLRRRSPEGRSGQPFPLQEELRGMYISWYADSEELSTEARNVT